MVNVIDMLDNILSDTKKVGGVEASIVASRDGLLMASNIPSSICARAETFAAMSATMLGAAETATTELGKGVPGRIIVESEHGKLIATGAGSKALFVVLTEPNAGLGLILVELEIAAEKIKKML